MNMLLRHIPLYHAQTVAPPSAYLVSYTVSQLTRAFVNSAVLFQDQSKRHQTRMILFFVCTSCNHVFSDPNLKQEVPTDD